MPSAKRSTVPHPDDAITAILGDFADVPPALLEDARRVLRSSDPTRFGVVQALILASPTTNTAPDAC